MDIKQRLKSLVNQFVIGMLPIFLFTVLSVTLNGNMVDYSSRFTAILIAGSAVYVLALLVSLCGVIRSFNGHAIMDFIKENKVMLIVLVVIILTRLPFINLLQRWDAGEYYYRMGLTLDNFSYSTFRGIFLGLWIVWSFGIIFLPSVYDWRIYIPKTDYRCVCN